MKVLKNYINGKFEDSESSRFNEFMNPALDEVLGKVPISTEEEVNKTVEAAKAAFLEWRKVPGIQRTQPLLRLLTLIKENVDSIAESIVINHGKEWNAAAGEVVRTYQMIETSLAVPEYQKGQYMSNIALGIDEYSIPEPLGVFIMIPPFNFPAMVPFWFLPFAVASGNTYIVKSNEQTPLALQNIFNYIDEAGFPPGVINYIHGDVAVANQLIEHPDVVGVSSVGSTPVAQAIYKKASSLCKRAQCHGGANNFLVITENANIEKIMPNLMNGLFGNSGQRCLSGAVVMVVGKQSFYDNFKEKLIEATNSLKIGYSMDKETFMGPVISKTSLNKLKDQIQNGIDEGASLILDGRGIKVQGYEKGYFIGPC
jgi:malonate-semialdehyde dehydrogenase (acetylating)/methylmalonate-semialdehyde dehydrogenase